MTATSTASTSDRLFTPELEHEQVRVHRDARTGLILTIAIHSTALGPALGGLRLWAYPSVDDAVRDAMRLSRAMTFKAAGAGLKLGGGKATIWDDGRWTGELRTERMKVVGDVIASLDGKYITGEDIGTLMSDMDIIAGRTPNVIGKSPEIGGAGDPSPTTARGVLGAIRVSLEAIDGSPDLTGKRVGVVGVGKVGSSLAQQLADAGAEVVVSDVDQTRLKAVADAIGGRAMTTPELLGQELDVLAPCSLGELIDEDVARSLRVRIVAGGANNPLAGDHVADVLAEREILFVPDFISNCGGLIYVASEHYGFDPDAVERQLQEAHARTAELLAEAKRTGETPLAIALRQVHERVASAAAAR